MKTHEIIAAMRERYKSPEYALMFEVGNKTGFGCSRHADAVAVSLWPSRGIEIHGFEFKAFRSDWLKELRSPEKAETIAKYCDRWFVVGSGDVIKIEEVPVGWGWIEAKGGKLKEKKAAPQQPCIAVNRDFVAAMLRRASECDETAINAIIARRTEASKALLEEQFKARCDRANKRILDEYEALKREVERFEAASGVKIEKWNGESIGESFRVAQILSGNHRGTLEGIITECKRFVSRAEELSEVMKGLNKT